VDVVLVVNSGAPAPCSGRQSTGETSTKLLTRWRSFWRRGSRLQAVEAEVELLTMASGGCFLTCIPCLGSLTPTLAKLAGARPVDKAAGRPAWILDVPRLCASGLS
jgi:hypothetical protein